MNDLIFKVEDMTCGGCASRIQTALENSDSVSSVDIDIAKQLVTVTTSAEKEQISDLIRKAGYSPEPVSKGLLGSLFS